MAVHGRQTGKRDHFSRGLEGMALPETERMRAKIPGKRFAKLDKILWRG
jgi:hypothetical protein